MNNIRDIQRLNQLELEQGLVDKASWHDQFKKSAYIYAGGFDFNLNEGDLIAIFSQYGEIIDIDLVRDKISGKSKGFAFIAFEDQRYFDILTIKVMLEAKWLRSTVLSVDNLNGIEMMGRVIRVDHTNTYDGRKKDEKEEQQEFDEREQARRLAILPPHLKPRTDGEISSEEDMVAGDISVGIDVNDPMYSYLRKERIDKVKRKEEKESRRQDKELRRQEKKSKRRDKKDRGSDERESRKRNSNSVERSPRVRNDRPDYQERERSKHRRRD